MLKGFVQPWYQALADPATAQQAVLQRLLQGYAHTAYGQDHHAHTVTTIEEYRQAFPIITYEDIKPLIKRTMAGETNLLLSEPPIGWAITRGTTKGESKFIPMTPTDLKMRVSAGRALIHYALHTGRLDIFQGVNLNLNFPSVVGKVRVGDREVEYGYSSGIYVKHVSRSTPLRSLPTQDEIDALGGGKTIQDWERRFELAYERCKDENVTVVGGVAPTAITFGRYLRRAHRVYPKDLWHVQVMTLGSVPGINTHYAPALRAMYGPAAILEIYGATEGMFGQQRDERRAWVPNYDLFFFEVETRRGLVMLHEMRPGEMGSLVVSTPVLPRYKIGDLILAFDAPYFRCIGRDEPLTPWRYFWNRLVSLDFGPP
ncbi:MAG: GH3 auxin-responsive promoter family protein [Chloroflexi bacterium]|nr:GH3 auxin-responsive promoter family protein [Chloroflexota bacterium]